MERWTKIKKNFMAKEMKKINVADISKLAKKIRKPNEAWTAAIKRAAKELKK
jgi:hypothetical protein